MVKTPMDLVYIHKAKLKGRILIFFLNMASSNCHIRFLKGFEPQFKIVVMCTKCLHKAQKVLKIKHQMAPNGKSLKMDIGGSHKSKIKFGGTLPLNTNNFHMLGFNHLT